MKQVSYPLHFGLLLALLLGLNLSPSGPASAVRGSAPSGPPGTLITRAVFAQMIVQDFQLLIVIPPGGQYTFADVLPGAPDFASVETVAAHAIMAGFACGGPGEPCDSQHRPYFRPRDPFSRAYLARVVIVITGWPLLNPTEPDFADVVPNDPYYVYTETAYMRGVADSFPCGGPGEPCDPQNHPYYRPYIDAAIAQAANMIARAIYYPAVVYCGSKML